MHEEQSHPQSGEAPARWSFSRGDCIAGVGLFALAQLVYTLTLYPTVAYGDSGTLTSVAYTLGIAHPPGYPLYTLLANLFAHLPIGSIAWRVNLASAVFASGAAVLLYLTILELTRHRLAAVLSAGMYAFSPLVWRYALFAEVFALNNLFATIVAWLALRFYRRREQRILYLLAFATGLGMSHHHTLVFWVVPVWVWLVVSAREDILRRASLAVCPLLVLLGLTPYLYLRLAAMRGPEVVWGDLSSWVEFVRHVRRFQYGSLSLVPGASGGVGDVLLSLGEYFYALPSQMLFVAAPVAVWGMIRGIRGRVAGGFVTATVVAYFLYLFVFHALARVPVGEYGAVVMHLERFWLLPTICPFVWFGYVVADVTGRRVAGRVAWAVAAIIVAVQLGVHYGGEDQHGNRTYYDNAKLGVEHLPAGALLLSAGDLDNHTLQYVQACEHLRDDVAVVSMNMLMMYWAGPVARRQYSDVRFPGDVLVPSIAPYRGTEMASAHGVDIGLRDVYSLSYLIDENIDDRPIYTTRFQGNATFANAKSWTQNYVMLPVGTINKVIRRGEEPPLAYYLEESLAHLPDLGRIAERAPARGSREFRLWVKYWSDYETLFAVSYYMLDKPGATTPALEKLASIMEDFGKGYPGEPRARFSWDLAAVYAGLADHDPSRREALDELWQKRLRGQEPPSESHDRRIRAALGMPVEDQ